MPRRSLAARIGVIAAAGVAVAIGGVLAFTALSPAAVPPAAAREPQPPLESDHCYVEGMLMHHAQALELSELVLAASDVSDRVRALAEFIVADQSAEIAVMTSWTDAWADASGAPASAGHAAHGAAAEPVPASGGCTRDVHALMSGMATTEQLASLDAAEGAAAQRLFLELMIVHHEGALVMAEDALVDGANAFVRSSAKHVIVEQAREVAAMTDILAETP